MFSSSQKWGLLTKGREKKPARPKDGTDTGVFLVGYLVAHSASEEKKGG